MLEKTCDNFEAFQDTLVVASYNIGPGRNYDIQRQMLLENNVEVVGLQEVDYNNKRYLQEGIESENPLRVFKSEPFTDYYFGKATDFAGGGYWSAILSKYKLSEAYTVQQYMGNTSEKAKQALNMALKDYDPTNIKSIETLNKLSTEGIDGEFAYEQRILARSVFKKAGKKIAFFVAHLSYSSKEIREDQIKQLYEAMINDPEEYVVAVGDFNVSNPSEFDIFKYHFNLANGSDGVWIKTFTQPDKDQKFCSIDNIIVSKNISIKKVKVDCKYKDASDHLPIIAQLKLM